MDSTAVAELSKKETQLELRRQRAQRDAAAWEELLRNPDVTPEQLSRILADPKKQFFPISPTHIETQMMMALSRAIDSHLFNLDTEEFIPNTAERVCRNIATAGNIDLSRSQPRGETAGQLKTFATKTLKDWTTRVSR